MSILHNVLIALDQAVNCLIRIDGDWGRPDETLSARAWRVRERHPQWHVWIDRIFFLDKKEEKRHCQLCYESEVIRAHLPEDYWK
jgi:hypothetical protein